MSPGEREAAELLVLVICIALPLGALVALTLSGLRGWGPAVGRRSAKRGGCMPAYELRPWRIFRPGSDSELRGPTLKGAKHLASTRFPVGFVAVEHETSGEEWVRERGAWRQRRPAGAPEAEPAR